MFAVFPHMHRLGTAMTVRSAAGPVLDLPAWDFGDQGMVPVSSGTRIPANAPIQTSCAYDNTTDATVRFGQSTNDEMCIAVLYYWPAAASAGLSICAR